jgi:hypothetical protein
MRHRSSWIRGWLFVALVAAVAVVVARALGPGGSGDGLVPTIGGDTWPPVPVKDARPV